ncbi:30S ribosomal protein S1 [Actinomycetaceae bacterium TAE3-ERU4]|nr:30S ribosomal protein S1 [Actinomycetaceae bacterium TAE3-ERU4]
MTTTQQQPSVPQVAINDIGSQEDLIKAIDSTIKYFNDGDIVEGTVVKVDHDEVLLDIGYKTEGVILSRELSIKHDVSPEDIVKVGDTIEALVQTKEDKEGRLMLSKKRAQYERAWGAIEKIKDEDGVVSGSVIEVVKGGLILDIGLRGFLPASLVEMRRVRDLQPYIGRELEAKIIELDKNRNNVVLSRRSWLEQTQSEVRSHFLNTLQKGQVRSGVVSSIVNFGAFVDLGGVDGLVHVSELSWKHIDHPGEVVEVGQEVTVEVLDVDMDRERVSLSLKATQEDPWQTFARTHAIGQVVPGKVTKLVPFGAFVHVEDGIEGLVHISELAQRHVEVPEQVVKVGSPVFVKVIDIDLERRRISLSLKQANEGVDPSAEEFDPSLYGMAAEYDENGNYKYPEGFDPETNEWLEGYDAQREAWEAQYAEAQARWEAHKAQVAAAAEADRESASAESSVEEAEEAPASYSSTPEDMGGTLASDEALAALREKLTNN